MGQNHLDDANGLPGEMVGGVEEEGEEKGEASVPTEERWENIEDLLQAYMYINTLIYFHNLAPKRVYAV